MKEIYRLGNNSAKHRLLDKVVLITGAANGIGRATALQVAAQGATVILLDKNKKALEQAYDSIASSKHAEPILVVDDLATLNADRSDQLASQIENEFGSLNGLLHFAAEPASLTPLEHTLDDRWLKTLQTNLNSVFVLTRSMLPLLRKAADSTVIFSSGEAARQGRAYWGASGVAWGALDSMAGIWRDECGVNDKIAFYCLDPGAVNTPMRTRIYPGEDPGNPIEASDVADAYVYLLAAGDSSHMSSKLSIVDNVLVAHLS
jgi:NAD(P)-dependent dehydrogenase (short-subunit alcohol dehydrogenase family)